MMNSIKNYANKIISIIKIIIALCYRRSYYHLHFIKECEIWKYDFKHWGWNQSMLAMVCGTEVMLDNLAHGKDEVTIDVFCNEESYNKWKRHHENVSCLRIYKYKKVKEDHQGSSGFVDRFIYKNFLGANYEPMHGSFGVKFWICPCTLAVLGRYPEELIFIDSI